MKKQKKLGISLIILIITVIVMIIIAGVVILNISDNEILGKSGQTVFKNNIAIFQEEFLGSIENEQTNDIHFERTDLFATKTGTEKENIFYWIPSIEGTKYEDYFEINSGELVYIETELTEEQVTWCNDLRILKKEEESL